MNVALFVTCLADHYFAEAAADAVRLLRSLGCTVTFPTAQTCCGQPAYNAGRHDEARSMARHTLDVFGGGTDALERADPPEHGDAPTHADALERADAVVLPSGSCAAMVKKFYPRLLGTVAATDLARRTWELAEFIVHCLGVTRLGDGLAGQRVAVHQGCHALRELRLETEPAILLAGSGAEVVDWEAEDECCGFGGLFSIRMNAVSAAMADRKLDTLPDVDFVVSGDGGCVLQLDGRSRARGDGVEFVHLATALWRGAR